MEAAAYDGPSIVIAYAPCIAHGIDMMKTQVEQKRAVDCGYWPLYRYNPAAEAGKRFAWECKPPSASFQEFIRSERRYTALLKSAPKEAEALFQEAEEDAKRRMAFMESLGKLM
jgi:pyruvate-ferredoxin/flavodoxin oxidoreductase